jgi:3''-phosphoadenosine 5''-phosphosulfate sulfotransferase (PAPS reductase)/FAD synthetase and related enzymes
MVTKHIVGFSGGIDSQACAAWVLGNFPKDDVILMNSDAGGNEHPLTTAHVHWYSETVHPVVMVQALIRDLGDVGSRDGATGLRRKEFSEDDLLTFDVLAYVKGRFPSRKAQFCTEYLKLAPQKRWLRENLDATGVEYVRYVGVRADESEDRAKLPEQQWDDYYDCELVRPILRWTKKQCFEFVKSRGEQINPLYTMGFGRVGCAPCINSGKDDIRSWAARFPEVIDKVRAWEQRVGHTFFPPVIPAPEYDRAMKAWKKEWLISGTPTGPLRHRMVTREGAPPPPPRPINWVDDVVAWSKTVRGGKQFDLPVIEAEAEAGTCSSKYGLCE